MWLKPTERNSPPLVPSSDRVTRGASCFQTRPATSICLYDKGRGVHRLARGALDREPWATHLGPRALASSPNYDIYLKKKKRHMLPPLNTTK